MRLKSNLNLEALPTKEGVYLAVCIYRQGDKRLAALRTYDDAKAFFDSNFPMYSGYFRDVDLESFARKNDSLFPKFSYCGPMLHKGRTVALLGDAIHSVKPFFGLGANSAFEDVMCLNDCLAKCNDVIPLAIQTYSQHRGSDVKAMVEMSHQLDTRFKWMFILPLVLDTILHRAMPFVFSPSTLASFNDASRSFKEIEQRKRLDRVMQIGLFAGIARGVVLAVRAVLRLPMVSRGLSRVVSMLRAAVGGV